jgi:hypothetical protein
MLARCGLDSSGNRLIILRAAKIINPSSVPLFPSRAESQRTDLVSKAPVNLT